MKMVVAPHSFWYPILLRTKWWRVLTMVAMMMLAVLMSSVFVKVVLARLSKTPSSQGSRGWDNPEYGLARAKCPISTAPMGMRGVGRTNSAPPPRVFSFSSFIFWSGVGKAGKAQEEGESSAADDQREEGEAPRRTERRRRSAVRWTPSIFGEERGEKPKMKVPNSGEGERENPNVDIESHRHQHQRQEVGGDADHAEPVA